jgi:hypothetical protein
MISLGCLRIMTDYQEMDAQRRGHVWTQSHKTAYRHKAANRHTSAICLENFKSLLNKIAKVDPLALIQLSNQYEAGGNQLRRRECM